MSYWHGYGAPTGAATGAATRAATGAAKSSSRTTTPGWYPPAGSAAASQDSASHRPAVTRPVPPANKHSSGPVDSSLRWDKDRENKERLVELVVGARRLDRPGKEVKLWTNNQERQRYHDMADLFSVIKETEHWERAYRRGYIDAEEYKQQSWNLINRFKTMREAMRHTVTDIPRFISEYKMDVPMATRRLVEIGVPATIEHGVGQTREKENESKYIATVVASFITVMDAVKLNMVAVDQLVPGMTDIMENLNKMQNLPPNFEGKVKIMDWLTRLNGMSASDTLDENQARQIMMDLDSAYNKFHSSL